jgi:hypothetical protein
MNTENNKLIAEFLGFQETKFRWYDYEEGFSQMKQIIL